MGAMPQPQGNEAMAPTGDSMEVPDDDFSGAAPDANMPDGNNGQSEFDTNFDAGVEADEDSDPKKYIQQLTGKLSQSLRTYNNENGDDAELSKYVGKMIVKQAAKGLDDAGKKDLIKTINTTSSDESENDDEGLDDSMDDFDNPTDDAEEPVNEECYTVGKIDEILGNIIDTERKKSQPTEKRKKTPKSPFNGKQYK